MKYTWDQLNELSSDALEEAILLAKGFQKLPWPAVPSWQKPGEVIFFTAYATSDVLARSLLDELTRAPYDLQVSDDECTDGSIFIRAGAWGHTLWDSAFQGEFCPTACKVWLYAVQLHKERQEAKDADPCQICGGTGVVDSHDPVDYGSTTVDLVQHWTCDHLLDGHCCACGGDIDSDSNVCVKCGKDWSNDLK